MLLARENNSHQERLVRVNINLINYSICTVLIWLTKLYTFIYCIQSERSIYCLRFYDPKIRGTTVNKINMDEVSVTSPTRVVALAAANLAVLPLTPHG